MKKILTALIFSGLAMVANAQGPSVEKSIFGIQTGFAGLWAHYELKIADQFALRTELGLEAYKNDDFYPEVGFLLTTVVTAEPRWYYNLKKRGSQSKRIDGNSGNFFAFKTSFHFDELLINLGDDEDAKMVNDLSIVPTWGMRRNIGKHFNYEAGFGIGYIRYFAKKDGFSKDKDEIVINIHARIGYRF